MYYCTVAHHRHLVLSATSNMSMIATEKTLINRQSIAAPPPDAIAILTVRLVSAVNPQQRRD